MTHINCKSLTIQQIIFYQINNNTSKFSNPFQIITFIKKLHVSNTNQLPDSARRHKLIKILRHCIMVILYHATIQFYIQLCLRISNDIYYFNSVQTKQTENKTKNANKNECINTNNPSLVPSLYNTTRHAQYGLTIIPSKWQLPLQSFSRKWRNKNLPRNSSKLKCFKY